MKVWVDDLRLPPKDWVWAKTSEMAIAYLKYPLVTHLSLDHDLGGDDTTRRVVLWMCENDVWPEHIAVHTANPVGREWLEGMIARYRIEACHCGASAEIEGWCSPCKFAAHGTCSCSCPGPGCTPDGWSGPPGPKPHICGKTSPAS